MKRIPYWKLKRELTRPFRQQLPMLPERAFSWFFGSTYYDLALSVQIRRSRGARPVADKVAVYVIFPTDGVTDSHIAAIEYLDAGGYAPLVVSNLPLSDQDRRRLLDISYQYIERPNYGYDFGGYREGVLTAIEEVPDLKRLVLSNDSCWFPLPGSKDWLAQAEGMNLDFVGAVTHFGFPRVETTMYREISWTYFTTHKHFHIASFALMISAGILKDRAFIRFWKRFPLSNRKSAVVRRGETGLTKFILSKGYSHGATQDNIDLDKILAGLSDQELLQVARDLVIPEERRLMDLKARVLAEYTDRWELEALILTVVALYGSSYVIASFLYRHSGFAFLKKSPVWLDQQASDLTIAFVRRLEGSFGKSILNEALELRRCRAPSFYRIEA